MNLFIYGLLLLMAGCQMNVFQGVGSKRKTKLEVAHEKAASGDVETARALVESTFTSDQLRIIRELDPLGDDFIKAVISSADPFQSEQVAFYANLLGLKNGISISEIMKNVNETKKGVKNEEDKHMAVLFGLFPHVTKEALHELDVGVALLEGMRLQHPRGTLSVDHRFIQTVLAASAFAGSIVMMDQNKDQKISVDDIEAVSDYDMHRFYQRALRVEPTLERYVRASSLRSQMARSVERVRKMNEELKDAVREISPADHVALAKAMREYLSVKLLAFRI